MITRKKAIIKLISASIMAIFLLTGCSVANPAKNQAEEDAKATTVEFMESIKTVDSEKFQSLSTSTFLGNENFESFFDKDRYYKMALGDFVSYDGLNWGTQKLFDQKIVELMGLLIGEYEIKDVTLDSSNKTTVVEVELTMKKVTNDTVVATEVENYINDYINDHFAELQSDYVLYGEDYIRKSIVNNTLTDMMDMIIEDVKSGSITTDEKHTINITLEKQDDGRFLVSEGTFK